MHTHTPGNKGTQFPGIFNWPIFNDTLFKKF